MPRRGFIGKIGSPLPCAKEAAEKGLAIPVAICSSHLVEDRRSVVISELYSRRPDGAPDRKDPVMFDFAAARRRMVDNQIRTADVTDLPLLGALDTVARELFLPEAAKAFAYSDQQLEIGRSEATGERRRALPPVLLARMVQAVVPVRGHKVLDVGCGTGYAAAIFAVQGAKVVALDEDAKLVASAAASLAAAGVSGVKTIVGPLAAGAPGDAPFDLIFIEGAYEEYPAALVEQLAANGHLIGVEGVGRAGQVMLQVKADGMVTGRPVFDGFAPLLGAFAKKPSFAF
jgi:protein-L-isoaspartate(D-aspartate) O-methyltransferase